MRKGPSVGNNIFAVIPNLVPAVPTCCLQKSRPIGYFANKIPDTMKKTLFSILSLILSFAPLAAQQTGPQSLAQLQESPAGSHVLKFLTAFNEGREADEALVQALFSENLIEKHGLDKLAAMVEDIQQNNAPVQVYEALRPSTFEYQLKIKGGSGEWVDAGLTLEDKPPYKIEGLALDITLVPSQNETPIWPAGASAMKKAKPISNEQLAQKAQEIARAYADMGWFSGAILLSKNGQPFYREAFGHADEEKRIPNTMDTKFRIGSINKDYTAVLVLQQVQEGKLSLDDKLAKFGLGFPAAVADKIAIRHLLAHTSGFADIFIPEYLDHIRRYKDIDDILPLLRDEPLAYEPGTGQQYSNYGYIVLGAILEKTTGKPFGKLLQENILKPIGAQNTRYDIAENIEGEAQSYRYMPDGSKLDHTPQLEYPTPDGGMYATADDLLAFVQALCFSNTLINDEMKALIMNDYRADGPSWAQHLSQAGNAIGFAGGGPGVNAVVEIQLNPRHIYIVLANTDHMVAEEIMRRIRDAAAGHTVAEARLPAGHFLYRAIEEKGAAYVQEHAAGLLREKGYGRLSPQPLNQLGYQLLRSGATEKAIEIFKLNVALFPEEANPCDSLGEAYLKAGNREQALKFYKKALAIDPLLPSAARMVRELEQ